MPSQKPLTEPAANLISSSHSALRKFHAAGYESLKNNAGRLELAATLRKQGNRAGFHVLHKARALAQSMTSGEIEKLIARAESKRFPLTKTAVIQALSIPNRKERLKFIQELIDGHWTIVRTQQEMAARYGKRRIGAGRRARRPADDSEVLHRLRAIAEQWRRLYESIQANQDVELGESTQKTLRSVNRSVDQMLRAIRRDVAGSIEESDGKNLIVRLMKHEPANPDGTQDVTVMGNQYTAQFQGGRLIRMSEPRSRQNCLTAVIHKLLAGDKSDNQQVRLFPTGIGWQMELIKMNKYVCEATTTKTKQKPPSADDPLNIA